MKKYLMVTVGLSSLLSYAKIEYTHKLNPYATHQPVLYTMATKTTGPIIEFGCGVGSTALLHEICKKDHRLLVSVEDDLAWLDKYRQKYLHDGYETDNSGWHKFYYIPRPKNSASYEKAEHWIQFLENFELLQTTQFELCFVDQAPWQARTETVLRLKEKVKYIILHDCDFFAEFSGSTMLGSAIQSIDYDNQTPGIYDFSKIFAHFKVYFPVKPWAARTGPPTLLGSNYDSDLPEIDYENF